MPEKEDPGMLRLSVAKKVARWMGKPNKPFYSNLCLLLGLPKNSLIPEDKNTMDKLRMLDGPNGYAVYKMLIAKNDASTKVDR